MRLFDEVKGYATMENAIAKLTKELARHGRTLEDTRWLIVTTSSGRFAPVVQVGSDGGLIALAHSGVGVM